MKTSLSTLLIAAFSFFGILNSHAEEIKIGIIGLDTSHVIAFTKAFNDVKAEGPLADCKVVAAYPKGSPDIESSVSRVPKYTAQLKEMGVEIVPSIEALLEKVDAVCLETNDGRPHLEQVLPVLKAKKRVFIDKPIAASLEDSIAIFEASKKYGVPLFSSSSLRFAAQNQAVRNGSIGKVTYAKTGSPASIEKTHPDLFWYGIHGVESLFTLMGTGCESVVRSTTDDGKIRVTGKWSGGRTGIFEERKGYGGTVKGEKGEVEIGKYDGYKPLVIEIAKYFHTGKVPVSPEETLEIYAFMEAADESKRQGGKEITLASVMKTAKAKLDK
ncbi:MAG: Gfo/Idh/MocA family oxidoreductase [Verrucomicrobia bacterium]|nr:Gfo/Idh/MocA family oxidoreductase [Verrucomicrobiota bacterium]